MTMISTTISYFIAITLAQVPVYFIQRYFFKQVMDRQLDKLENRLLRRSQSK